MTVGRDQFRRLLASSRAGSAAATQALLAQYGPHVLRAVRRRLPALLRRQFDSIDFVQDVWASFFTRFPTELRFETPEAFQGFLAQMAKNKVADQCRRLGTRKRDVLREVPAIPAGGDSVGELPDRGRTASEAAMSKEAREALPSAGPDAFVRIAALLRQGHSHQEAAQHLGISVDTLRRRIRRHIGSDPELRRRAAAAPRTRRAMERQAEEHLA